MVMVTGEPSLAATPMSSALNSTSAALPSGSISGVSQFHGTLLKTTLMVQLGSCEWVNSHAAEP